MPVRWIVVPLMLFVASCNFSTIVPDPNTLGPACETDADCRSRRCVTGRCLIVGAASGQACEQTDDCSDGLTCGAEKICRQDSVAAAPAQNVVRTQLGGGDAQTPKHRLRLRVTAVGGAP